MGVQAGGGGSGSGEAERNLVRRLASARVEAEVPLSPEQVEALLRQIVASLGGDLSVVDLKLYAELEALARYIQDARAEIASIRPDDIRDSHIPAAADELDAVVGATEEATHRIMDACDVIGGIAATVGPAEAEALTGAITNIFEACNFQDITGQRINKVVKALKHIESRIGAVIEAFGIGADGAPLPERGPEPTKPVTADDDSALIQGPGLPGNAIDQDEIDRLLASFD